MNHPEEFTKTTPNHIEKWVLRAPTFPPCLAFARPRANQIIKSFHGLLESSQTAKFTYANKSNNISSNNGQRSSEDNHIMGV